MHSHAFVSGCIHATSSPVNVAMEESVPISSNIIRHHPTLSGVTEVTSSHSFSSSLFISLVNDFVL